MKILSIKKCKHFSSIKLLNVKSHISAIVMTTFYMYISLYIFINKDREDFCFRLHLIIVFTEHRALVDKKASFSKRTVCLLSEI